MKILITGAYGQLGRSLQDTQPEGPEVIATDYDTLDIGEAASLPGELAGLAPDLIINAGAYTAVDKAESEPDLAQRVNGDAVAVMANYCRSGGCRLLHISTDFVFDGSQTTPWRPDGPTGPLSVYGRTKLAGEEALRASGADARVIRTSWVYSEHGNNFVKTMLRLGADRDELTVVADQVGSPTYARNLAEVVWRMVDVWPDAHVLHYCDAGETSWQGFAETIFAEAVALGLLETAPVVLPTTGAAYGAPAPRPAYSVLDTSLTSKLLDFEPPPWREALRAMLARLSDR